MDTADQAACRHAKRATFVDAYCEAGAYTVAECARLFTAAAKHRLRPKIHAEQLLTDFAELPKFNWDGPSDWPPQRHILNRLAPVLFLPYVPVVFLVNLARERDVYSPRENVRLSFFQGLYAGMLQFYVAKYRYFGQGPSPAAEPPRPGAVGARPLA